VNRMVNPMAQVQPLQPMMAYSNQFFPVNNFMQNQNLQNYYAMQSIRYPVMGLQPRFPMVAAPMQNQNFSHLQQQQPNLVANTSTNITSPNDELNQSSNSKELSQTSPHNQTTQNQPQTIIQSNFQPQNVIYANQQPIIQQNVITSSPQAGSSNILQVTQPEMNLNYMNNSLIQQQMMQQQRNFIPNSSTFVDGGQLQQSYGQDLVNMVQSPIGGNINNISFEENSLEPERQQHPSDGSEKFNQSYNGNSYNHRSFNGNSGPPRYNNRGNHRGRVRSNRSGGYQGRNDSGKYRE